jgi:hypothetical protein
LREYSLRSFEQKKSVLRRNYPFSYVLTWKEREWHVISLGEMEKLIEELLIEIARATDEDMIRSHTFLIRELIEWYGFYVDKINIAKSKAEEMINQLELEISGLERKFKELFRDLIKATGTVGLQVELQELQGAKDKLGEIKKFLEKPLSIEEIEKLMKPLIGDKKSRDVIRKDKLITDVDAEQKKQGMRGDWTIPEYVLMREKREEIINEVSELNRTLESLRELSVELTLLTEEISKLF